MIACGTGPRWRACISTVSGIKQPWKGACVHGPKITHHARVTQCLGAASATQDFYLAVHEPTLGADGVAAPPDPAEVRVFRVAPHTFVKLHRGTWHAGPLWGADAERVYYNLELHDTNEVDHNTVVFDDMYTFEPCA